MNILVSNILIVWIARLIGLTLGSLFASWLGFHSLPVFIALGVLATSLMIRNIVETVSK